MALYRRFSAKRGQFLFSKNTKVKAIGTSSRRGAGDDWDARTLSGSGKLNQDYAALAKGGMDRASESAGSAMDWNIGNF